MTLLKFTELPLSAELQKGILAMGFHEASPIQAEAIPLLLDGVDLIGQAQTGTGKTAAFAIPIIERIDIQRRQGQALVVCPTRELAVQVAEAFKKLGKFKPQLSVCAIYGGEPIARQFRALQKKPQIIVGTPGRLLDHLRRGTLRLDGIQTVVLDEADEMLNMGFRDDIELILENVPKTRQTVLFSATMPAPILELTARYQQNPRHVHVAPQVQETPLIDQLYIEVQRQRKLDALVYLIEFHQLKLALVFCNTKRQVDDLVRRLQGEGYSADGLHGGMTQPKRDKVMGRFRKGMVQFLVATDVAARGIDVQNIEAVFNYDMPDDQEYYIHRIGRTGRAGKRGRAFTFVEKSQVWKLKGMRKNPSVNLLRQEIPAPA